MVIVKVQVLMACVAGAKRGGGGRREKRTKEGRGGEGSACYKSWCFCIQLSIHDQSQVGGFSTLSELNYFVYRKLSSRDAFFK